MKRLAIIFFVLVFLGEGLFLNVQAGDDTDKAKALDALEKFTRDVGLSIQGYDLKCVHAIEEMEKEGKLSHGQALYLINKECKTAVQQPPSSTCPICGEIGTSRIGFNGIYYICPRGHAWR